MSPVPTPTCWYQYTIKCIPSSFGYSHCFDCPAFNASLTRVDYNFFILFSYYFFYLLLIIIFLAFLYFVCNDLFVLFRTKK